VDEQEHERPARTSQHLLPVGTPGLASGEPASWPRLTLHDSICNDIACAKKMLQAMSL